MQVLTWQDVLGNQDLIDGEIEVQEGSLISRGPLSKIEAQGDQITFHSPWCARLSEKSSLEDHLKDQWEKMDDSQNVPVTVSIWAAIPWENEGVVTIRFAFTTVILRPKGKAKLDPETVVGFLKA